jgi:hypothetical protein
VPVGSSRSTRERNKSRKDTSTSLLEARFELNNLGWAGTFRLLRLWGEASRRAEAKLPPADLKSKEDNKVAREIPVPLLSDTFLREPNRASLWCVTHNQATSNWLPRKCD